MRTLRLPANVSPREQGRAHGETFRSEIREIAAIRTALAVEQGRLPNEASVLAVAALHLPILSAFDDALSEELIGIAEGADVDPARIVVLNHYTDLKDLGPEAIDGDEDCSAIAAKGSDGHALLAQTWDMHGSAAPYVAMIHVPEPELPARHSAPLARADSTRAPLRSSLEAWVLSIVGCLGMAGMNARGVGVCINNLKSHDARVGVVWPALVRRMLREEHSQSALHVLMTAPMSSGHHYLIASAEHAYGVETSGRLKEIVWQTEWREREHYVHTNHCLGPSIAAVSWVSPTSTSVERYEKLSKGSVRDARDLWSQLGSHEGHPRSVCTHLASARDPHAMLTCAGVLMDLSERSLFAAPGCIHGVDPISFPWGHA